MEVHYNIIFNKTYQANLDFRYKYHVEIDERNIPLKIISRCFTFLLK